MDISSGALLSRLDVDMYGREGNKQVVRARCQAVKENRVSFLCTQQLKLRLCYFTINCQRLLRPSAAKTFLPPDWNNVFSSKLSAASPASNSGEHPTSCNHRA